MIGFDGPAFERLLPFLDGTNHSFEHIISITSDGGQKVARILGEPVRGFARRCRVPG